MKFLKLFITFLTLADILIFPVATLSQSSHKKQEQLQVNLTESSVESETECKGHCGSRSLPNRVIVSNEDSATEPAEPKSGTEDRRPENSVPEEEDPSSQNSLDAEENPSSASESNSELEVGVDDQDETDKTTPEEIARLEKLALADQLYLAGDKTAAVKLYREVKEVWSREQTKTTENPKLVVTTSDPSQLSPAGKVFWRNYQQGKKQQFESKVVSSLKLLTTREPQFIPGHVHYAKALLAYEREAESLEVLNRAVSLYPNEPAILRAKMNADIAEEKWLDASIMARQYALFNPDSPQAEEFELLAEVYLAEYQDNLRSSITWNAIGNAIAGTVGFVLTGNLFGPLSALETTALLLQGESAVGEASVSQIKKQLPLMQDETVNDYVDYIGQKIATASGREEFDYQFYIVMDDALNAFALPGGKIFVNVGAIMQTDSEAELAGLLAHEVSHSALSHGFQLATKGNLTANIVSYVPYVGNTASSLIVLNYSREMEKQADIFGTRILVNAGYAADGVRNLMARLDESNQDEARTEPPAWLSSHPNTRVRIDYMEQLILDQNLDRYTYEGVEPHQAIKKLVTAKWKEYEKCVEEVDSIQEAKICAGEKDESKKLDDDSPKDSENSADEIEAENEESE
ncbi:MAG: M48 family metalloprotease [Cyanobacteria bacterium P01_A01_bin.40]